MSLLGGNTEFTPGNTAIDPNNTLLKPGPAILATARGHVPGLGSACFTTIRTETTTLTLVLDKKTLLSWAAQLKADADKMSGSGLITGNGQN